MINFSQSLLLTLLLCFITFLTFVIFNNNNTQNGKQIVDKIKNKQRLNNNKIHVPKFMLDLYENGKTNNISKGSRPDIVRSIIPKHADSFQKNELLGDLSENHLLIFHLPELEIEERFLSAELKILTLVAVNATTTLKGVQRFLKISTYNDINKQLSILQTLHIHHFNNTWLSFNLTDEVAKVLEKNTKLLKIVITITEFLPYYSENKMKLSLLPINDNVEHNYPVLLLEYAYKKKNSRIKRSLEEDYEEETNSLWNGEELKKKKVKKIRNTCRRKPLYVDFSEIDYDMWIVQPAGYEAYQCQGRCFYPVAEHLSPTKHAIIQALLHSVAPGKVSRSCCVPTILDSISILYVDSNGVLTYRYSYEDMVVLECGCR